MNKVAVVSTLNSPLVKDRASCVKAIGYEMELLIPETLEGSSKLQKYLSLVKKMACEKNSLIHIHFAAGPHAGLACVFSCKPVVVSIMGADILFKEQPSPTWSARKLSECIIQYADAITTKSEYLKTAVAALLKEPKNIETIYWGVNEKIFYPHAVTEKSDYLFSPRTCEPLYNTESIIGAFAKAYSTNQNLRLILNTAGNNPAYIEKIKKQISEFALKDVITCFQSASPEEMASFYNRSKAVISIPHSDGLPQTIFEAWACGKPILLSDLPQYKEITKDGAGYITCDGENIPSITEGIHKILQMKATSNFSRKVELLKLEKIYKALEKEQKKSKPFLKAAILFFIAGHFLEMALKKIYK